MKISAAEVDNWFTYHPPTPQQKAHYEALRSAGRQLAHVMNNLAPDSEEKCEALCQLRQAVMWANAAIACNDHPMQPGVPT